MIPKKVKIRTQDGDEIYLGGDPESHEVVDIRDRVKNLNDDYSEDEIELDQQSEDKYDENKHKKVKLSGIYYQKDFNDPMFQIVMTNQSVGKSTSRYTIASAGLNKGFEDLNQFRVLCPYRDKDTYKKMIDDSQKISKIELRSIYQDMLELKMNSLPAMLRSSEKGSYESPHLPGMIFQIDRKKDKFVKEIVDKRLRSLQMIQSVAVEGKTQIQVSEQLECSQSLVSKVIQHFMSTGEALVPKQNPGPLGVVIDWKEICNFLEKEREAQWKTFESYSTLIARLKVQFPLLEKLHSKSVEIYLRRFLTTNSAQLTFASSKLNAYDMNSLYKYYFKLLSGIIVSSEHILYIDETCFQERSLKRTGIRLGKRPVYASSRPSNFTVNVLLCNDLDHVVSVQVCSHRFLRTVFVDFFKYSVQHYKKSKKMRAERLSVLLDNCSIHFCEELQQFIIDENVRLLYLMPKAPLFNMSEFIFRSLKEPLRKKQKSTKAEVLNILKEYLRNRSTDLRYGLLASFLAEARSKLPL